MTDDPLNPVTRMKYPTPREIDLKMVRRYWPGLPDELIDDERIERAWKLHAEDAAHRAAMAEVSRQMEQARHYEWSTYGHGPLTLADVHDSTAAAPAADPHEEEHPVLTARNPLHHRRPRRKSAAVAILAGLLGLVLLLCGAASHAVAAVIGHMAGDR
jgi:hypothetical protein